MCAAFRSHRKSATSSGSRSRPSARQFNRDVLTLDEAGYTRTGFGSVWCRNVTRTAEMANLRRSGQLAVRAALRHRNYEIVTSTGKVWDEQAEYQPPRY